MSGPESGYRIAGFPELWNTELVPPESDDWKCLDVTVSDKEFGATIEYKIHFYRKTNGWYDEVRYDSHEIKKGRKILAPHLHMKLATPFKDPKEGEEELKRIIDMILPGLKEITR